MPTLIDPQQIFPRRLGVYRGAIVIQYYNLERDCFKKHLIPYDSSQSTDKILQNIFKNPKHSAFLRKVSPNHLRLAISGKSIQLLPSDINEASRQNQFSNMPSSNSAASNNNSWSNSNRNSSSNRQSSNGYSGTNSYTGTSQPQSSNISSYPSQNENINKIPHLNKWEAFKKKQMEQNQSYNLSVSKGNKNRVNSSHDLQQSHNSYSMNFDQQSMNISVVPVKQIGKSHAIQQQIDYEEDFQELSAEKLDIKTEKEKQKQKQRQRQMQRQRQRQRQREKQKQKQKQKKKENQKQKKKIEKQLDQFQFLDEQPKKKKKKKKEKSKDKDSSKSKSKNTSENPSKQVSVKQQIPIEEQFDFI